MSEVEKGDLRKDYILDRWVYFVPGRKLRPKETIIKESEKKDAKVDYFAPGNESMTPPELGRIPDKKDGWSVRWFENKFPALLPSANHVFSRDNFFMHSENFGFHEVIVDTPSSEKQLHDLSVKEIAVLLDVYSKRILDLEKKEGVKYVLVFKNFGSKAGASILHSHSQVMATSLVPTTVADKVFAVSKFIECPYCKIIELEKNSPRLCFENDFALAFCPYASMYNFECWIFPKEHIQRFENFDFIYTAELLKKVLSKLAKIDASYCFAVHYAPHKSCLHAHIVVMPQIATWGGFERGGGFVINTIFPEDAAKFYRDDEKQ